MLRAGDLQQILLQTTSVERIQQTQQQQSELQQRYVATHASEEKKLQQEKVKESDESDKVRMQREEERERKRRRARDHQLAEDKLHQSLAEEEPLEEEGHGGRINIRV
jgi:hypothetical protein